MQGKEKDAEVLIQDSIRILEVHHYFTWKVLGLRPSVLLMRSIYLQKKKNWRHFAVLDLLFSFSLRSFVQEGGLGESSICVKRLRYLAQVVFLTFILVIFWDEPTETL